jgi:hypothetical protein
MKVIKPASYDLFFIAVWVVPRVMRKFIFDHVKTKPKQDQFSPYEGGGG